MINLKMTITGIIIMILGFSVYSAMLINFINSPTKKIQVDCYDKYGNVINGLTCNQEIYQNEDYNGETGIIYGFVALISFLIGIIGFFTIIYGVSQ